MIKIEYKNKGIKCVYFADDEEEAEKYIKGLFRREITIYKKDGKLFYERIDDAK